MTGGLVFTPTPDNAALRETGHSLVPASLGETLGAAFDDPTLAPSNLMGTALDIQREQGLLPGEDDFNLVGPGGIIAAEDPETGMMRDPAELSEFVDAETLNDEFSEIGLTFEKPTRRNVANILAARKRDELRRVDILARGPSGVLPAALRFGASLLRSAIDPLNVASAFVPVVGQARFAGMVSRVGLTRARLATGAIEGTAGAALVEPFVAGLSRQQQLDYSMSDALVNVGLGGLLGGGLHVAAGRIGDVISGFTPEQREALLRASVAQLATGRRVNVEPLANVAVRRRQRLLGTTAIYGAPDLDRLSVVLPERIPTEGGVPVRGGRPAGPERFDLGGPRADRVEGGRPGQGQSLIEWIRRNGGLRDVGGELAAMDAARQRPGLVNNRSGMEPDDARLMAYADQGFFDRDPGIDGLYRAIGDELAGRQRLVRAVDRPDADARADLEAASADRREFADRLGLDTEGLSDAQIENMLRDLDSQRRQMDEQREIEDSLGAWEDLAAAEAAPSADFAADFNAANDAEEILAALPGDSATAAAQEVDLAVSLVDDLRNQGALSDADVAALAEADAMVAQAEQAAAISRAAAVCLLR